MENKPKLPFNAEHPVMLDRNRWIEILNNRQIFPREVVSFGERVVSMIQNKMISGMSFDTAATQALLEVTPLNVTFSRQDRDLAFQIISEVWIYGEKLTVWYLRFKEQYPDL